MADESSKEKKSIPDSQAGGAVPNASGAMQSKILLAGNWNLKRIGLVAYTVATAVGYFYASSYYDSFGIDILDYAAPLDLLFFGLANVDKVVLAAAVVPLAFLLLLVSVPALVVVVLVLLFAAVSLVVVLAWIVLWICAVVVRALVLPVAIVQACALRIYWLREALSAIRDDKRERDKRTQTKAGQDGAREAQMKPLQFSTAYRTAKDRDRPDWKSIDPKTYIDKVRELLDKVPAVTKQGGGVLLAFGQQVDRVWKRIRGAYWFEVTAAEPGTEKPKGRGRFKPWSQIHWPPRLLVLSFVLLLLLFLFATASRLGIAEADCVRQRADVSGEETSKECAISSQLTPRDIGLHAWETICSLMRFSSCPSAKEGNLPRVFAVPTGNLASLEFADCSKPKESNEEGGQGETQGNEQDEEKSGEQEQTNDKDEGSGQSKEGYKGHLFVRANFRQDAGDEARRSTPACLVRLNPTGSMQFFADFSGDRKGRETDSQSIAPVVVILNNSHHADSVSVPPPPETGSCAPRDVEDDPAVSDPLPIETSPVSEDEERQKQSTTLEEVNGNGQNGAASAGKCDMIALVGPFDTGASDKFDKKTKITECHFQRKTKSARIKLSNVNSAISKIREGAGPLVLLGRADIRPIKNNSFPSNMDLTEERADWVKKLLEKKRPALSVSVLPIPGGLVDSSRKPADSPGDPVDDMKEQGDDPCARVVEIYQCPGCEPVASAGAEGSSDAEAHTAQNQVQLQSGGDGQI